MFQRGPVPSIINMSNLNKENVYDAQLIEGLQHSGLYEVSSATNYIYTKKFLRAP